MAVIIILFILLLTPNTLCQDQEYIFTNITRNANLSQHFITSIIEDDNGIMWFGTHDGLNYYDGYNFKRYSINLKDKNSISNNYITSLAKDDSGNIWIGTQEGLNKLNLISETITVFKKNSALNSLGDDNIVALEFDRRGFLWIATREDGLYKLDLSKNKFTKYLRNNSRYNFNFHKNIRDIKLDYDGDLWVLYQNDGIVFLNLKDESIKVISSKDPKSKLYSDSFFNIDFNKDNSAFIVSLNHKLITINKKTFSVTFDFIKDKNIFQNLYETKITKDGTFYLVISSVGLCKYDPKINKFFHTDEFVYNPQDSLVRYISKIYIDSRDNIWLGSSGYGIGVVTKNSKPFINYSSEVKNAKYKLSFPSIRSIYEDSDGNVFVSGYDGLNLIDKKNGKIKFINDKPIYSIDKDLFGSNDYLTVSFESFDNMGTLYRFNKKNFSYQKFFKAIKNNYIRSYLPVGNSEIWIGFYRGLYKYDFKTSQMSSITIDNYDLSNETINCIFKDRQNNIWVSTKEQGLFYYNSEKNIWKNFKKGLNNNGLSSNLVYSVFQDSRNKYWICTNTGLNLFNPENNTFKVFNESDGLPNNVVYNIIEDNQGYLWLSTNLGISRFDYERNEFWNFDIRDGIACNEQNFKAVYKGSSGTIYFGGISGLTSFNPSKLKKKLNETKVLLSELKLIPEKEKKSKLYNAYSRKIELDPDQKTLNLKFTAISDYSSAIKSMYRYKISGINDDWVDVGFNREITLANLSPGEYQLLVNASNNDGIWTKKPLELTLIVRPQFWQTTWFLVITIMIGIILIIGFVIMRIQFLKRTNIKLENIVKERTKELEASKMELELANSTKNRFFSIVAHDLKNPFNALINYSDILLTDFKELTDDEKIKFIKGIKDSSESTYKFLQNLLIWARAQTNRINCIPKEVNIKLVVDDIFKVLNVYSNDKKIKLISSLDNDTFVFADENMLNTIFINLLTNAIKYSNEGHSVYVDFVEADNNSIKISIRDEGVGMNDETLKRLFQIEYNHSNDGTKGEKGTGLGLIITNEFIKANNGKIEVESKQGVGTTFYITLPAPKNTSKN